ncbi:MAG: ECF transporter S component [Lachnospiraceae bacterium]|nr:ECF transporter S component [Lachnospiraceae bacterium]
MSKEFINNHYYVFSVLIIFIAFAIFCFRFEKKRPQAREMVTLAVMSAIAVAARAAFVMVPHFKPMSGVIMISGMAFGPGAGFLIGSVSAFVSNFMFGQGAWTPWQMLAYGMAGMLGGFLRGRKVLEEKKGLLFIAAYGFVAVVGIVGPILDTSSIFLMPDVNNAEAIAAIYASGLPLNVVHGLATFLTLLLLTRPMLEKLNRIMTKYGVMKRE